MNAIDISSLTKVFGTRTAVDALQLQIGEGEFFALLGQNGAGKTTTIRMLCGLLPPSSGDAFMLGDSIVKNSQIVKQKLGISPQETAVAPNLTVFENLVLMAQIYGADKTAAHEKALSMLEKFSLGSRTKDKAKTLSGGMQRRLSIAMALISEPAILFLDEPTLGLDVRARRDLWNILLALKGQITIVLTTHYMEEAEALSDRIGVMHDGRLRALGTVQELKALTGTDSLENAFLSLTEQEETV